MANPFSRAQGYIRAPEELIIEDAPPPLRYLVIRAGLDCGFDVDRMLDVTCRVLGRIADPMLGMMGTLAQNEINQLVEQCDWFRVYDLIVEIHLRLTQDDIRLGRRRTEAKALHFAKAINAGFEDIGIGWQLVNGEVIRRGDQASERTINKAAKVLRSTGRPTAAERIRKAVQALSKRPTPDTSGSVSHSTSAIECVLDHITGEHMTLGGLHETVP